MGQWLVSLHLSIPIDITLTTYTRKSLLMTKRKQKVVLVVWGWTRSELLGMRYSNLSGRHVEKMELHQDRQSPLMMRCPLGKWIQGAQLYPSPTNTAKTEPFKAPSFTSTSISAGCIHSWEISLKKEELHFFIFVFKQQHVFPNEFGTQPPDMIRCPRPPPHYK